MLKPVLSLHVKQCLVPQQAREFRTHQTTMIKVHQTYFKPGIITSINKNFVNNIFVMIMYSENPLIRPLYNPESFVIRPDLCF